MNLRTKLTTALFISIFPNFHIPNFRLLLKVNPFDSLSDGGEDFVRNGPHPSCHLANRLPFAEKYHGIILLAGDICYVCHAHVHTDRSRDGGRLSVDQYLTRSIAQPSAVSVGVPYRDYCNPGKASGNETPPVTYRFTGLNRFYLGNC